MLARFQKKFVQKPGPLSTPCWIWTAGKDRDGYGKFDADGKTWRAHRFAWTQARGPIPSGMLTDHLCRDHACVNPEHLELVTPLENTLRGESGKKRGEQMKAKTHCPHGHPYDEENTYVDSKGKRRCRACWKK